MTGERLREAARVIRSLALPATPGEWVVIPEARPMVAVADSDAVDSWTEIAQADRDEDAVHIATWHPDAALAVANWLDAAADSTELTDADPAAQWHLDQECDCPSHREVEAMFTLADAILAARS